MALYTAAAVLSKLDTDFTRANGNAANLANDLAAGKLYCTMAFEQIDRALGTLSSNYDEQLMRVSTQLTGIE